MVGVMGFLHFQFAVLFVSLAVEVVCVFVYFNVKNLFCYLWALKLFGCHVCRVRTLLQLVKRETKSCSIK